MLSQIFKHKIIVFLLVEVNIQFSDLELKESKKKNDFQGLYEELINQVFERFLFDL